MKIRIRGEVFDLPPPVPAADEIVMAAAKYFTVDLAKPDGTEKTVSLFNLRKVAFFVFREGFSQTLAKIRAVLSKRKLGTYHLLVVAIGTDSETGRPVIALGGQDCPDAEQLCFRRSLASISETDVPEFDADVPAILAYCAANPVVAAELRDLSQFSGRKLEVTLEEVLAEGRRLLASGVAPAPSSEEAIQFASTAVPPELQRPIDGKSSALFLAGAGTYPCAYALPAFSKAKIPFDTVIELNPARAALVARQFGFASADTDVARGLRHLAAYEAPVLVIATYHSTHMEIAELALSINPATRILIEKPPVATMDQLHRLARLRRGGAYIEIGYNRRHIPMTWRAREQLATQQGPVVMTCIAKIPRIPASHWYFWQAQGTRVTGNACHWIDLGRYFISAAPERVVLFGPDARAENDPISLVVCYADGSRLNVVVTDSGSSLRGVQEFIEVRRGDMTVTIDDYLRFQVQAGTRRTVRRVITRDKGHDRMYARFVENIRAGRGVEYPDEDLIATSSQYLLASEALQNGNTTAVIDVPAVVDAAPARRNKDAVVQPGVAAAEN